MYRGEDMMLDIYCDSCGYNIVHFPYVKFCLEDGLNIKHCKECVEMDFKIERKLSFRFVSAVLVHADDYTVPLTIRNRGSNSIIIDYMPTAMYLLDFDPTLVEPYNAPQFGPLANREQESYKCMWCEEEDEMESGFYHCQVCRKKVIHRQPCLAIWQFNKEQMLNHKFACEECEEKNICKSKGKRHKRY